MFRARTHNLPTPSGAMARRLKVFSDNEQNFPRYELRLSTP